MRRPPHTLLRWLRLVMACLALAIGGTAAQARAMPVAPVAGLVLVDRSAPAESRAGVEHFVHVAPLKPVHAETAPPVDRGVTASRVLGPARRLFLLHRALLR